MSVIILIGLSLFVLFCLARRFAIVRSWAIWLARQLHALALACRSLAILGKNRSGNDLAHLTGNNAAGSEQIHYAGIALSRLLAVLVSLCVILGSFPIDQLRAALLNGILQVTILRLPLDIFQGLEWLLVPGVFGMLFLEAIGLLPTWATIFPRIHARKSLQWSMGVVMGIALVVALIVTFYFQVFGQCVIAKAACAADASLQIYTGAAFDVLSTAAAVVSLACIFGAGSALLSAFLALVATTLLLLSLCFGLLGEALATLGQGGVSNHHPFFDLTSGTPRVFEYAGALPLPPETVPTTPLDKKKEAELMADNKRYQVNSMLAFEGSTATSGSFSYRFLHYLLVATQAVGALESMVATGLVTLNTRPQMKRTTSIATVSPTQQEIEQAIATYDTTSRAFQSLAHLMVNRIVQAYGTFRSHGTIVVALDLLTIHDVENALREMKQRLAKHRILVVTAFPEEDQRRDERFLKATNTLIALQQEEIIETTILLDVRSPLATEKGEKTQEEMAALTIASLFFSHLHDAHNLTPPQVLSRLGGLSPFIGMSIGSGKIATGQAKRGWAIMRRIVPLLPSKGIGDLNDAISQSKIFTRKVVEEEQTRAMVTPPDVATPFFILYMVPIRLDDPRFSAYANDMRAYLARTYPMAQAIIVRGNGTADAQLGPGYYVQATAFYPLAPGRFLKSEASLTDATGTV